VVSHTPFAHLFKTNTFETNQFRNISEIPVFNQCVFWDVHFDRLDYEKEAAFIITRVF